MDENSSKAEVSQAQSFEDEYRDWLLTYSEKIYDDLKEETARIKNDNIFFATLVLFPSASIVYFLYLSLSKALPPIPTVAVVVFFIFGGFCFLASTLMIGYSLAKRYLYTHPTTPSDLDNYFNRERRDKDIKTVIASTKDAALSGYIRVITNTASLNEARSAWIYKARVVGIAGLAFLIVSSLIAISVTLGQESKPQSIKLTEVSAPVLQAIRDQFSTGLHGENHESKRDLFIQSPSSSATCSCDTTTPTRNTVGKNTSRVTVTPGLRKRSTCDTPR